jgi:Fe-S cluster biogenesis protein NfuA
MEAFTNQIEEIINKKIRPRVRVDGGDILFSGIEGSVIHIDAFADCAVCPCCEPELTSWIEKQIKKELGISLEVRVTKHKPYFA